MNIMNLLIDTLTANTHPTVRLCVGKHTTTKAEWF